MRFFYYMKHFLIQQQWKYNTNTCSFIGSVVTVVKINSTRDWNTLVSIVVWHQLISLYLYQYSETYHPTLDNHYAMFTQSILQQLINVTHISPLRFQDQEVNYEDSLTYYSTTIHEQSPAICKCIQCVP